MPVHRMWMAVACCVSLMVVRPAAAQTTSRVVDPAALLRGFQHDAVAGEPGNATSTITEMMLHGERFRPADVAYVFGELERLVLEGASSPVRGDAAWCFALAGSTGIERPRTDIVARSARLYARSADDWVKETLVSVMRWQADRPAAIRFLSGVISDSVSTQSDDSPGRHAVIVLANMGEEGQAELRHLHEQAHIVDAASRRQLEFVAQQGYRNR